jgi:riboflavin kinase/FMN adenylyltransferase
MAVFFNIDHLPAFKNPVITIGTFDGVHLGHRTILEEVARIAAEAGGDSILLTFEPHPRKLLQPGKPLGILTPLHQKLKLILATGIRHVIIAPFTEVFAHQTAENYIREFLVGKFHPHTIIIGYDHQFGHGRAGNIDLLRRFAPELRYQVREIPGQLIDEAFVSSTKVRQAIRDGRVNDATDMLGRPFAVAGKVIHGDERGRTIGYPTANIEPADPDQILPARGVYAVQVTHKGNRFGGMLNIGVNPTVTDRDQLRIEVHLFDFDKQIYGETLDVSFVQRVRDEVKFDSLDALIAQLKQDEAACRQILSA